MKQWIVVLALVAAVAVAGVVAVSAGDATTAQQDPPTTDQPARPESPLTSIATALGMEEADLAQALQDGRTIADLAAEKSVDLSTIVDILIQRYVDRTTEAVAAGRITQEQADAALANVREQITSKLSESWSFGGFGFGGGRGGFGGGRPGGFGGGQGMGPGGQQDGPMGPGGQGDGRPGHHGGQGGWDNNNPPANPDAPAEVTPEATPNT